jgi:hypothetical protein
MRKFHFLIVVLTSLTLALAACGSQQEKHEDMAAPAATSEVAFEPGAWMDMTLTDSRTGVAFTLSDYSGKVVLLEMMDPGCAICKDQVKEVAAALDILGDKAVAVSLDVGLKGEEVQVAWADRYGATWAIAQIPTDFAQALVKDCGGEVVYPGNTPVIIIDPSGTWHVTEPGIKKSLTLVDLANQWIQ